MPPTTPVEGAPATDGDRHAIVIDRDHNRLYELYRAFANGDGSWNADCGAVFHLDSDNVRPTAPAGWTSADAAGLPIFPGLACYDEAALGPGGVRHALRFTVPATFSAPTRALLTAMKTYGMIVADNGSNWYVSGAPDDRWNNDALVREFAQVHGSDFEVVRMDGLVPG